MQNLLKAVIPKTLVDGFSGEIIKHSESIMENPLHSDIVIDYFYSVRVLYDGSRQEYGTYGAFAVNLSQKLPFCNARFTCPKPLILLESYEQLKSINIVETTLEEIYGVYLLITTNDSICRRNKTYYVRLCSQKESMH